jgi:hypothetical protein
MVLDRFLVRSHLSSTYSGLVVVLVTHSNDPKVLPILLHTWDSFLPYFLRSHLTALRNDHVLRRLALRIRHGPRVLDFGNYVHAFSHPAKDDVFAIEMRRAGLCCDDEELATVGVWTGGN